MGGGGLGGGVGAVGAAGGAGAIAHVSWIVSYSPAVTRKTWVSARAIGARMTCPFCSSKGSRVAVSE